jgi:hypothetical protein
MLLRPGAMSYTIFYSSILILTANFVNPTLEMRFSIHNAYETGYNKRVKYGSWTF